MDGAQERAAEPAEISKPSARVRANKGSLKPKGNLKPVPNPDFEVERYSVYIGRRYLGRCERVAPRRYKAYDARNRLIGGFTNRAAALSAIDGGAL